MFAGKFANSIGCGRRAGLDGLVVEVALDVAGEGGGRFVAAFAVFFECLHHNPVELAAQNLAEAALVETAVVRDRGDGGGAERAEAAAGAGGLVLADDAAEFV